MKAASAAPADLSRAATRDLPLALATALVLRLVPILIADRLVADVLRYQRVAAHVLDVSWNPYEAPRLYPYPPLWIWIEAASEWLARRYALAFPVLVKLPVLLADLIIVAWLAGWGRRRGRGSRAAWLYAIHPVSVFITGFHGQFDSLAILLVLLALSWHEAGRRDRSALALSAGIAAKSFPVLLLPLFLAEPGSFRQKARFAALATLPVAALLLPYALDNPGALRRELIGYGGVADLGWIALYRGLVWLSGGGLPRSEAQHWGGFIAAAKVLFLSCYAVMVLAFAGRRLRWSLPEASLAVFLAFYVFYGAVSAQYLVWVVPLGALLAHRHALAYGAAATLALVGFYSFLAPGVLYGEEGALLSRDVAGRVWVAGVGAVLAASLAWLVAVVRRGIVKRA